MSEKRCPACGASGLAVFHRQRAVPVNSCLLLTSATEATEFPTGAIELALCPDCGFITNLAFDPALAEYSDRYEETQAFSERFVSFASALAQKWVDRHQLVGKTVLEIGCGKGEFLALMVEAGIGRGIGIDPGVKPDRIESAHPDRLEWIADFYTDAYAHLEADAVVCRHTLEHISPVADFLRTIRQAIGDRLNTVVLFELPDAQRILEEVAFWDVYYEHCSYFTAGSIARLFEREHFEVLDLTLDYDDQYLILDARPVPHSPPDNPWPADDRAVVRAGTDHYRATYGATIASWERRLRDLRSEGGTAVIWGAGSKGVSFLSAVGEHIRAAVDINPNKHGMFLAGTGHETIAPDALFALEPDLIIAMNPIYLAEIQADLDAMGVEAELVAL